MIIENVHIVYALPVHDVQMFATTIKIKYAVTIKKVPAQHLQDLALHK